MTINLANRTPQKDILPPRVVLYGPPKIGKTTFASCIPHNLLIDVEGGSGAVEIARVKKEEVPTFDELMGVIEGLYSQQHAFTTVTFDSIDWVEQLVFDSAAKEHQKTSIADVGYGAGYVTAQNKWKQMLEALDWLRKEKGIMVLFLAHEQIKTYNNPLGENYDRYGLKLRSNDKGSSSESIIKEWADVVAFVNKETFIRKEKAGMKETKKGTTSDRVFIHTCESPAYLAGNRYNLPEQIPFSWADFSEALNTAMTSTAPNQNAA